MARKKRDIKKTTPLAAFLKKLEESKKISTSKIAQIAGCSASVIYDWKDGSMPSETVGNLKKLCNHYGVSLSTALTGAPDEIDSASQGIADNFNEVEFFDGYARIKVYKLEPRKSGSK